MIPGGGIQGVGKPRPDSGKSRGNGSLRRKDAERRRIESASPDLRGRENPAFYDVEAGGFHEKAGRGPEGGKGEITKAARALSRPGRLGKKEKN